MASSMTTELHSKHHLAQTSAGDYRAGTARWPPGIDSLDARERNIALAADKSAILNEVAAHVVQRCVPNRSLTLLRLVCLSNSAHGLRPTVVAGQEFECEDPTAIELLRAGFVRKPGSPAVQYETKVIVPHSAPQVSPRQPFRHLPVSDARPETVASEGD